MKQKEENHQINVGDGPVSIAINSRNKDKITGIITNTIYEANFKSDTVSVISGDNILK